MSSQLRQGMVWLHTWAGVAIGALLFVIFWMGTLSVFDREIDRWMMPATRLSVPAQLPSLDATVLPVAERLAGAAPRWSIRLPDERTPVFELRYTDGAGRDVRRHLDPATGALLPDAGSVGANGFFFPFHFSLHLRAARLGYWLVGVAGMAMLVLLISGVIVHRRMFTDFFTFRPRRALPRATLDLHNLTGVLALPFHFVVTLSGLVIFFSIYFPVAWQFAFADDARPKLAFEREAFGRWQRPKAGEPGALASLDAMLATAQAQWQGGRPYLVRIMHPRDAAAYVEVRRSVSGEVGMNLDIIHFDGASGAVLQRHTARPVMAVQRFVAGLHFIQFRHGLLRTLYFFAGLSGCVMIVTGLLFWLQARRGRHGRGRGVRVVEAMTVAATCGTLVATLAFLIANRLLPDMPARATAEMQVFFAAWAVALVHAACRGQRAWRVQSWAIGALALAAVVLNALTTGDHLAATLTDGQWAVAGVDGALLVVAAVAAMVARRLGRVVRAEVPAASATGVGGV